MKVLLLENIHPKSEEFFKRNGYEVESLSGSLDENVLSKKIKDVHVLGIRSKTKITSKVLENAENLLAIGAFCIGTNQINIKKCNSKGIVIFNAPFSNTRSVVELAIGNIISLMRGTFDKSSKLHHGMWEKSASRSFEVRGKKLGIIGYGNIGSQLSVLAELLGMKVYFYDIDDKLPLGNAENCSSMEEVLELADVVTVHVDGRPENTNLISQREFDIMKDGAIFINLSRGSIVDINSLAENVKSGKLGGVSVDVYPSEPVSKKTEYSTVLQELPNTILTPHIAGSTEEAQQSIAEFVPAKIYDFIKRGSTVSSVNFPNLQLPLIINGHRLVHIHENVPGIMAKLNNILARHKINIEGQYLKTNQEIGYVITDIKNEYDKNVIGMLENIEHTVRLRLLF